MTFIKVSLAQGLGTIKADNQLTFSPMLVIWLFLHRQLLP